MNNSSVELGIQPTIFLQCNGWRRHRNVKNVIATWRDRNVKNSIATRYVNRQSCNAMGDVIKW